MKKRIIALALFLALLLVPGCYSLEALEAPSFADESSAAVTSGTAVYESTGAPVAAGTETALPRTTAPPTAAQSTSVYAGVDALILRLERKYGCRFFYGDDIPWEFTGVSLVKLHSPQYLRNLLELIEPEMDKYPAGFFAEFSQELRIYLVASIDDNNIYGIAAYTDTKHFKLYLATNPQSMDTLHHEMMHMVDYTIRHREAGGAFPLWDSYNPSSFRYGVSTQAAVDQWVWRSALPLSDTYFVSEYATTDPLEDRAEIFGAVMTRQAFGGVFTGASPVREKYQYIVSEIRRVFRSVQAVGRAHWETPPS